MPTCKEIKFQVNDTFSKIVTFKSLMFINNIPCAENNLHFENDTRGPLHKDLLLW